MIFLRMQNQLNQSQWFFTGKQAVSFFSSLRSKNKTGLKIGASAPPSIPHPPTRRDGMDQMSL